MAADGTAEPVARRMWRVFEPIHAVSYFSPETRAATDAAGLKGGWMSYFGCRAAPLGPVVPEVVVALFYVFNPAMVRRALPDAWSYAAPERLLELRLNAAGESLRRLLGEDGLAAPDVTEAAELATAAAEAAPVSGRPLAAANAALPWADQPHLRLWQSATRLRESRGDGHVASLVNAGIDPTEALVTASGVEGGPPARMLAQFRKWSEEEWAAAVARLRERGLADADGRLTRAGAAVRTAVEDRTDELAEQPWRVLGERRTERLHELLTSVCRRLADAGGFPSPNPIGLTLS